MISSIQNFLGKHHKWLFSILLAVIIVAFVLTIGNTGGLGFGQPTTIARDFYGFNIDSQREQRRVVDNLYITAELEGRRINEETFEEELLGRLVLLHLADVYEVPGPNEAELREFIRRQALFRDVSGTFSADLYSRFIDSLQSNPMINETRISEVLAQNFRIEIVRDSLGGPGYVLPYEAREDLAQDRTTWTVEVGFLPLADFEPEVDESDEALEAFFAENPARYQKPAQWVIEYVQFPYERYAAALSDPEPAELEAFFAANSGRFRDSAGDVPELEEVRDEVIARWKEQRARRVALAEADEFSYTLFDKGVEMDSDTFTALLADNGLERVSVEPFSRGSEPFDLPISRRQLMDSVYQLNDNRYFSGALQSNAGAVVLLFSELIPEQDQELEAVRDRVLADYRAQERMEQFAAKGNALRDQIREALKDGGSFSELAGEAGAEVSRYEGFTESSPPPGLDQFVLFSMRNLQQGDVSPMLTLGSGGYMTFVEEKVVPEISFDDPEVVETMERLATFTSNSTTRLVLAELIEKGLRASGIQAAEDEIQ